MSIISKTLQEKKEEKEAVPTNCLYTAVKGVIGSKGALMPKAGDTFMPENEKDIEILEYFVSIGIVTKTEEA